MNDSLSAVRMDGWKSLFTGLGGKKDKTKSVKAVASVVLSDAELSAIYKDDGLGASIVDLLAEDALKQGWRYVFANEKEGSESISAKYEDFFARISFKKTLSRALKWARLYGGAVIMLGAYDGEDLSSPLQVDKIKKFGECRVFSAHDVDFSRIVFEQDATSENFGKPLFYTVRIQVGNTAQDYKVHHSRILEIKGVEIPNVQDGAVQARYRYWGLPVLQRVSDKLANLSAAFSSVAELLQELCINKYKFRGLAEIMAEEEGGKQVQKRIETIDLMKSVFHSVFVDAEEDIVRDTISFGGVSELLTQFMQMICSETGYPMTKLFGISPGGLNATGESDTYNYYDRVKSEQELTLMPLILRVCEIVSQWQKWEMPKIEFNPLEQMTEREKAELEKMKAETEKMKAETYQNYFDLEIMSPEIIEELEFGDTLKKIRDNTAALPSVE